MKRHLLVLIGFLFIGVSAPHSAESEIVTARPHVYPIVSPRISSNFGKRTHPISKTTRHHHGIDLAAPKGAHVRSVAKGLVVWASVYKGYGKLVTVRHDENTYSMYGHLSKIDVKVGQDISAGDLLGRVGSTGNSTGNHLHFEWRVKEKAVNPRLVLPGIGAQSKG